MKMILFRIGTQEQGDGDVNAPTMHGKREVGK